MMNVDKYGWTFLFYHFPQRFRWQFPAAKSSLSQVHYLKLRDHDIGWLPDDDRFRLFELRSKKHHDWWHWDESGTADFLGLMITNMFLLVVLCLPNRENHTHLFKPHILTHDWMKIQFGYTFEEILDEFLSNSACHHWLYVKIGYPHIWCLESFTFLMPWQFLTATPNFQTQITRYW